MSTSRSGPLVDGGWSAGEPGERLGTRKAIGIWSRCVRQTEHGFSFFSPLRQDREVIRNDRLMVGGRCLGC